MDGTEGFLKIWAGYHRGRANNRCARNLFTANVSSAETPIGRLPRAMDFCIPLNADCAALPRWTRADGRQCVNCVQCEKTRLP